MSTNTTPAAVVKALLPPIKLGDEVMLKFDAGHPADYLNDRTGVIVGDRRLLHNIQNVIGAHAQIYGYQIAVVGPSLWERALPEHKPSFNAQGGNIVWVQDCHVFPLVR